MSPPTWALISGEYPPQPGGVADYTRLVARGLATAGDDVHVFSSGDRGVAVSDESVQLHRLKNHFGMTSLGQLDRALRRLPVSTQIVVEYTPHAFGYKAMNLPFCAWLARRYRHRYWVMFHEVAFPFVRGQPWRRHLLAVVTRGMASMLARNAGRCFVSIQGWEPLLRELSRRMGPCHWLPVPSNVPCQAEAARAAQIRQGIVGSADRWDVIGHFGTYESSITGMLDCVLPQVLQAHPRRMGLLIGRGSAAYADHFVAMHPSLKRRVTAAGGLPASEVTNHLAACDLLVQPYPGGACTRRGTLMAGLGLGLPIVSTSGEWSDDQLQAMRAVECVPEADLDLMPARVTELLNDTERRQELGKAASAFYRSNCSVECVVASLRGFRREEAS